MRTWCVQFVRVMSFAVLDGQTCGQDFVLYKLVDSGSMARSSMHLTCLYAAGFGTQVGQVDIGFPAINYGVGILAGSLCCSSVCHCHLVTEPDCQQGLKRKINK